MFRLVRRLELKVPPLMVLAAMSGAMVVGAVVLPQFTVPTNGPVQDALALMLALVGGMVSLAGVVAFRRAGTTVNPLAPEATSVFVVRGIYRHSRNPMYLGFLLALTGFAVFLGHLLGPLFVALFIGYINRFQIEPEEQALRKKYGADHANYCASVRRWI